MRIALLWSLGLLALLFLLCLPATVSASCCGGACSTPRIPPLPAVVAIGTSEQQPRLAVIRAASVAPVKAVVRIAEAVHNRQRKPVAKAVQAVGRVCKAVLRRR